MAYRFPQSHPSTPSLTPLLLPLMVSTLFCATLPATAEAAPTAAEPLRRDVAMNVQRDVTTVDTEKALETMETSATDDEKAARTKEDVKRRDLTHSWQFVSHLPYYAGITLFQPNAGTTGNDATAGITSQPNPTFSLLSVETVSQDGTDTTKSTKITKSKLSAWQAQCESGKLKLLSVTPIQADHLGKPAKGQKKDREVIEPTDTRDTLLGLVCQSLERKDVFSTTADPVGVIPEALQYLKELHALQDAMTTSEQALIDIKEALQENEEIRSFFELEDQYRFYAAKEEEELSTPLDNTDQKPEEPGPNPYEAVWKETHESLMARSEAFRHYEKAHEKWLNDRAAFYRFAAQYAGPLIDPTAKPTNESETTVDDEAVETSATASENADSSENSGNSADPTERIDSTR